MDLPPEQITESIAVKLDVEEVVDEYYEQKAISLVNHFAYGAASGAFYMSFQDKIDSPPIAKGVGYAMLVWAGSYLGWLPAAGILRPATEHPASQNGLMIAAHVVWGAALALTLQEMEIDD